MKVVVTCEQGHKQEINYSNMFPKKQVELFAAILDGRTFIHQPGPESQLCKCGICGTKIKAEVINDE